MKRYGPIIGIVAAIIIVIVIVVVAGGDDDKDSVSSASDPTTAVTTATTTATTSVATTTAESTEASTDSVPATGESTDPTEATDAPDSTSATTTPSTEPKPITYPLSFAEAEEQGITVDWGERCDLTTGRVAVPDYFASECFAPFTGDNGGATATGVTADEITIAVYLGQETDPIIAYITDAIKNEDTNAQVAETITGVVEYFETYYETYGRKVRLEFVEGTGNAADELAARSDAVHIAEDIKPFMVWGGPALTSAFADELAAHQISCIACTPGQPPEWYVDRDPYLFGIAPSAEQSQRHALEFIQKQLIGKNAEHGGDEFVDTPRKFGLLYIESSATSKELADTFVATMETNGAPIAETISYLLDPASIQQTASQAIAKFKAAGVTSIIFNGDPVTPRDFTREATAQGYFPEWVIGASTLVDTNAFARTYDQEQWSHAFGQSYLAAKLDSSANGYYWLYSWFHGVEPPAKDTINVAAPMPGLFFRILESTGPNLTHETWKEALFNADRSAPAISQPSLSWGDHGFWPDPDYVGIDDSTLIWWDPTATGIDEIRKEGTGMYQFVDGGKRYLPGEWPTEEKLFDPEGAVSFYTTPPPGEAPPQYPSPAG